MTFLALLCFVETVDCGTITAAAKKLMMEQPNVSRQISSLEGELGFALFVREHRRLRLTEAGASYYEAVRDIPKRLAGAKAQATQIAHKATNKINVGVLEGQRLSRLLEKIEMFQYDHPDVSINLEQADFDGLKNGLKNGDYHFILTFRFSLEDDPLIKLYDLHHQTAAIAVHRNSPMAARENLSVEDLNDCPLIVLEPEKSPESFHSIRERFARAGVRLNCARYVSSTDQLFMAVEIGAGIAIVDMNNRLADSANVRLFPLMPSDLDPVICIACHESALNKLQLELLKLLTSDIAIQ